MKCMKFVIKDKKHKKPVDLPKYEPKCNAISFQLHNEWGRTTVHNRHRKNMGKKTLECLIFISKALLFFRTILRLIRHCYKGCIQYSQASKCFRTQMNIRNILILSVQET